MSRASMHLLLLGGFLSGAASCFIAADTLGLPCADADACDDGQSCQANVCVAAPDNLLLNPSFEQWGAAPVSWMAFHVLELTKTTEDPHDGELAVRMRMDSYASIDQSVTPAEPWPKGASFEARVWTRYVAGDTTPPTIELRLVFVDDTDLYAYGSVAQLAGLQWLELVTVVEATQPVSYLELRMVGAELEQTLEYDDASLVVFE
jgi:hypothetical protein